jgi:hypothetical protein
VARGKKSKVEIGSTFNRWTVVSTPFEREFPSGSKALFVTCNCSCGTVGKAVRLSLLTSSASNASKSCGCIKTEVAKQKREPPIVGSKFGRLEILEDLGQVQGKSRTYSKVLVICSCGSPSFPVSYSSIKQGKTISCGCYNKERIVETHKTHGMYKSKIYKVWMGIIDRIDNPNNKQFHDYGGRGISNLWEDFEHFLVDMQYGYFDGCEIDRIDVNGNYCTSNCRWVTKSVSTHNKRKSLNRTSIYMGVYLHNVNSAWIASLQKDGVNYLSKSFQTEYAAAFAYDNASEEFYGDRPNKTIKGVIP